MADVDVIEASPKTSSWINRLGPAPGTVITDAPAPGKEGTNGAPTTPANGAPAVEPNPGAAAAPAIDKPAGTAADPDKGKPDAAMPPVKPAATVAAADDDIDRQSPPKTATDWDKFKEKYKGRTNDLITSLQKAEATTKELETKYAEAQKQLTTRPSKDPEIEAQLTRMQKLIDDQRDVIAQHDIENEPRFKEHYTNRIDSIISEAKRIVGTDRSGQIETILKLPEGEYKDAQLKAFRDDIEDEDTRIDLRLTTNKLRDVVVERDAERSKWNEHGKTIRTQREEAAKQRVEKFTQIQTAAFDAIVADFTDAKNGNAMFQKREGADAWNKSVDDRIALAKNMIFSGNIKPETVSKLALDAVAYPALLQAYQHDYKAWQEEKAKFEAQVKALSAAQPNGGSGAGAPSSAATNPLDKKDVPPWQRNKLWAQGMVEAMQPTE